MTLFRCSWWDVFLCMCIVLLDIFGCWRQNQDSLQANTYGEVQLFENSDICGIIAGCFAVLCVFWGSQSQDPFPSNALNIKEVRNFPPWIL